MKKIDFNDLDNTYGGVILIDDIPHLFILDDNNVILDGIPIFDDDDIYMRLYPNEMIIVNVDVMGTDGYTELDIYDINDDNYDELTYILTPLKFHQLKTTGLTVLDIMDMGFFDVLVSNLISDYKNNVDRLN